MAKFAFTALIALLLILPLSMADCISRLNGDGFPFGIIPSNKSIEVTFTKPEPLNHTFDLYIESDFGLSPNENCRVDIAAISDSPGLKAALSRNSLETGAAFNNKPITLLLTPEKLELLPDVVEGRIKVTDIDQRWNFVLIPFKANIKFPRPMPSPSPLAVEPDVPFIFNDTTDPIDFNVTAEELNFSGEELNSTLQELNDSGVDASEALKALEEANRLKEEGRLVQAEKVLGEAYSKLRQLAADLQLSKYIFSWNFAAFVIMLVGSSALYNAYKIYRKRQEEEPPLTMADIYEGKGSRIDAIKVELKDRPDEGPAPPAKPEN
ncbi:MAG: hypothetical protein ABH863_04985 [Candidatus Micrarchaeota archaeon]